MIHVNQWRVFSTSRLHSKQPAELCGDKEAQRCNKWLPRRPDANTKQDLNMLTVVQTHKLSLTLQVGVDIFEQLSTLISNYFHIFSVFKNTLG